MDRQVNPETGRPPALRVVFIIRSFGFPEGMAATNRVRLLGRALLEQNVEVRVICMRVSERPADVHNQHVAGSVDGISFAYAPGSTVRSDSFVIRRWREARGYVWTLLQLCRLKARGTLDCVFLADGGCEKWYLSVFMLLRWLRLLEVPVVTELNELPRMQAWLPTRLSLRLSYLAGVDGAVAISGWLSEWAAEEARRIGRQVDIVEIPIVVDTREQLTASRAGDEQVFVYSASSEYTHDLAFVFGAMRRVWDRFPEAQLMVTGMQPRMALSVARRQMVLHAVDDGRIRICGYLDRPDLLSAYRRAAALLVPLHDELRSRARFPSKVGEYLASGRPIVTCNVGEIERFLQDGDTAFIAAPDDVAAFSEKMVAVLEDTPRAAAIGAAGRRVAQELFFYAPQGIRLKSLIERVSGATTRPDGLRR